MEFKKNLCRGVRNIFHYSFNCVHISLSMSFVSILSQSEVKSLKSGTDRGVTTFFAESKKFGSFTLRMFVYVFSLNQKLISNMFTITTHYYTTIIERKLLHFASCHKHESKKCIMLLSIC